MDFGAFVLDHARATELFSAYWDEELPKEELSALEEHLKSCVVCRREYQTFEKTVGAVGQLHHMMAPPDFAEGVRSRIRKRSRGRFFSPRKMAERIPYELFSLVMLGLILAIYVVLQLSHPANLKLP
jgi:anti-sigma factor RsiW